MVAANAQAPEVLNPADRAFDRPTPLVASQRTPILRHVLRLAIRAVRCDQLNALFRQILVKLVAVVRLVADDAFRVFLRQHEVEEPLNKLALVRACRAGIEANVASDGDGGGIHTASTFAGHSTCWGAPIIRNNEILNNAAPFGAGGGIFAQARNDPAGTHPAIQNNTIVGNTATVGGGFAAETDVVVTNCILWNCGTSPVSDLSPGGELSVTYSDVEGGWPGTGNLDVDPLFVDGDGADNDASTACDNDVHVSLWSPCVGAGDMAAVGMAERDVDGQVRVYPSEGGVDVGADEHVIIGDLDADGAVGVGDLAVLLSNYGAQTGMRYVDGDVDGDGGVDLSDLSTLLSVYGMVCE